jgi:hypothetical protein
LAAGQKPVVLSKFPSSILGIRIGLTEVYGSPHPRFGATAEARRIWTLLAERLQELRNP